jgi:hypothetical protein
MAPSLHKGLKMVGKTYGENERTSKFEAFPVTSAVVFRASRQSRQALEHEFIYHLQRAASYPSAITFVFIS